MKNKIICLLAMSLVFSIVSCGKEKNEQKEQTTKLFASMLLSEDEVRGLVSYEPVKAISETSSKSVVRYDSSPKGEDPVIVELYSYNNQKSVAEIYEQFIQKKEKRSSSQDVAEYDIEAYISYPSMNIYHDGYMVVVTAGSGANEEQTTLLKNAGAIVATHLLEYLKENPTDSNLIE